MTPSPPRGRGIALVGYRGTGKSTVGRIIADRLGRPFADSDREIEARQGRPIRAIFAKDGEAAFREHEARIVAEIAAGKAGGVVATGGGAILLEANRQILREFGFVVWLTADPETLTSRLRASQRGVDDRPALTSAGTLAEIADVLESRTPLYREAADIAISTVGLNVEEVADAVLEAWSRHLEGAGSGVRGDSMNYLWQIHLIYIVGLFVIGTVVGSFLNVCIYRIPWEKSVIWPGSHCFKCLSEIESRDNVPIFGWLFLRGACRNCHAPISIRYPAVEFLVGLLFVGVYLVDGVLPREYVRDDLTLFVKVVYHVLLVALLVAVTFIDADLTIVPASVTNTGIILGLAIGAMFPEVRLIPAEASTHLDGLWVGLKGLIVGAGLIWTIRTLGTLVFRREAMGIGDIYILAMIGSFLGWQVAMVTPFLASFVGLVPALWKFTIYLAKRISGRKYTASDREMPFGPYLSVAALILMMAWPWLWRSVLEFYFDTFSMLFSLLSGQES